MSYIPALAIALAGATTPPALAQAAQAVQPVKVEVVGKKGAFQLLRGGEPYVVKGAGAAGMDLVTVAARGGNSVRTWGVEGAQATLDAAQHHGLTVSLTLPVVAERFGFDYDNAEQVAAQRRRIEAIVRRYRDHPALLAWIIGNELDFDHTNPKVFNAVDELSRRIHELDPNHPTTTTISRVNPDLVRAVRARASDLDFLSLQLYGALAALPRYAGRLLSDTPILVSEWGPLGFWEVGKTAWGAPLEQNSAEKARHYQEWHERFIAPLLAGRVLGSYVFLWGQKQERTPTWFSMFAETGESTATVDAMQFAWTGRWPANRAPALETLRLDGRARNVYLTARSRYAAEVKVTDPEGDPLTYAWSVKPESRARSVGGDRERAIPDVYGLFADPTAPKTTLRAPSAPGPYRLFVTAYDGRGHAAHANLPFWVNEAKP